MADRLSDAELEAIEENLHTTAERRLIADLRAERAETARLRAALEEIRDSEPIDAMDQFQAVPAMQAIARAALNE